MWMSLCAQEYQIYVESFLAIVLLYSACLIFHLLLPGKTVQGYCCDTVTLKPLSYKLNGFSVLIVSIIIYYTILPLTSDETPTYFYDFYWTCLFWANQIGFMFSIFFFFYGGKEKYPIRCITVDQIQIQSNNNSSELRDPEAIKKNNQLPESTTSNKVTSSLQCFYAGYLWNPRVSIFHQIVDIKMTLYVLGAIGLEYNLLSCISASINSTKDDNHLSNALVAYGLCFQWFILDYMWHEEVHLYTYDLFAEKVGFKLGWGCLVFYPFFYPIGAYSIVDSDNDISIGTMIGIFVLFGCGWIMTRGANMQKFAYRKHMLQHKSNTVSSSSKVPPPSKFVFLGVLKCTQETIPGTSILCSGWWGQARHLNYAGEILQSIALSIPGYLVGNNWIKKILPWLYPLYYVLLFITRQQMDDYICEKKYGSLQWNTYKERVSYRIFPGVY